MNPLTLDEVQELIPEYGLIDLDRMLAEFDSGAINVEFFCHGDELRLWLEQELPIPKEEIVALPMISDVLITHLDLIGGWMSILHCKIGDEIVSFPFSNTGNGWIPSPMVTMLTRNFFRTKSALPPRLSTAFESFSDLFKNTTGRIIAGSLLLALRHDDNERVN